MLNYPGREKFIHSLFLWKTTESNIQLREFDTGLIGMRLQKLKNKLRKILYTVFSGL
jgi:hypothetical protein